MTGVLGFLGVREADDRVNTYQALASLLSPESRRFWDERPQHIARGVIHAGRFEDYFRTFRTRVLSLVHTRKTIAKLLEPKGRQAREDFWSRKWNNWRWRLLFRVFFSRFLMGRLGRDPEFFRYVEGSVSDRFMERAKYALTALPTDRNPYLEYIATGRFSAALPRYLERERFEAIRDGLDRLTLFHGPIEQAAREHADGGFDAFNLSDIFEYIDEQTSATIYGKLLDTARPGARLAYWNTLVPRSRPAEFAGRAELLAELSDELFAQDKAFFYCRFQVDEVTAAVTSDNSRSNSLPASPMECREP